MGVFLDGVDCWFDRVDLLDVFRVARCGAILGPVRFLFRCGILRYCVCVLFFVYVLLVGWNGRIPFRLVM